MPVAAVASKPGASVTWLRSGTESVWEVTEKGLARAFDPVRDKNQRHLLIKEGGDSERTGRASEAELLGSEQLSSEKV